MMSSLRKFNPRILIASLVLLLTSLSVAAQELSRAKPEEVGLSSERLQRLSAVFQEYVDEDKLSGSVIMIARQGKVAYLDALGQRDRESKSSMKTDSIFRIASQTKALVSVGVMILQEEGKLLISDPVGKYIPEFQETTVAVSKEGGGYDVVKANRPITIRDLLTHTAGINYGGGVASDRWEEAGIQGWYFADRDEPISDTITRLAALPFVAQPGERFVYGYNTDILGVVIERASGKTLSDFLHARLFKPLGMRDTHFYLPPKKKNRLAVVYSASDTSALERAPDPGGMIGQGAYVEGPRKSFSGGAGILSTAMDYTSFLQMMLNGGSFNGKHILSRKTVELMTLDHVGDIFRRDGMGFGLGFSIVEDLGERCVPGSVGEFGWGGAYHTTYWVDPAEQLVVTYFTQLRPTNNLDDHGKLRALIYQAIVE